MGRHKRLKLPPKCPEQCRDLTFNLLQRKEKNRLTSKQALAHEWLDLKNYANELRALPHSDTEVNHDDSVSEYDDDVVENKGSKQSKRGSKEALQKGEWMRENPVNNAVDQRRQELMLRM